eukprot:1122668-Amphidinium_carterae.1
MLIDFISAFLHARCRDPHTPPHLADTPSCWRLLKAMYGTLAAVGNFEPSRSGQSQGGGHRSNSRCFVCVCSTCRGMMSQQYCMVTTSWPKQLVQKFEVSVKAVLGPEDTDAKQCTILNRVLS